MQIDGILFDWGGTLAQVEGQLEALMRGAAEALTLITGAADPALVKSMIERAMMAEKMANLDPQWREVQLDRLLIEWGAEHRIRISQGQAAAAVDRICRSWVGSSLRPFEGAGEAIRTLKSRGLRIGLLSNCFIPGTPYCWDELKIEGIADLLEFAVFSSDVGYRKPSPRIYEQALAQFAATGRPCEPSRVLFVGDSPAYDVIAPARLGMKTALVTCYRGLWSAEDYERAKPDLRIEAVSQLPALLGD